MSSQLMTIPPQFHRARGAHCHSSSFHMGTKAEVALSATMPGMMMMMVLMIVIMIVMMIMMKYSQQN